MSSAPMKASKYICSYARNEEKIKVVALVFFLLTIPKKIVRISMINVYCKCSR